MIGDTVTDDGVEFEVVWSGGELIPARPTKITGFWTAPPRLYNKTGNHKKPAKLEVPGLDNPVPDAKDSVETQVRVERIFEGVYHGE